VENEKLGGGFHGSIIFKKLAFARLKMFIQLIKKYDLLVNIKKKPECPIL